MTRVLDPRHVTHLAVEDLGDIGDEGLRPVVHFGHQASKGSAGVFADKEPGLPDLRLTRGSDPAVP